MIDVALGTLLLVNRGTDANRCGTWGTIAGQQGHGRK